MGEVPDSVTLEARTQRRSGRPWLKRALRCAGWLLIAAGAVVLLYLVYSLFYTNLVTERAQRELLSTWEATYGPLEASAGAERAQAGGEPTDSASPDVPDPGDAYAVMWFERPGSDARPVHAEPLTVVEGVDPGSLQRGPGHYPDSAAPGQAGNFAVAGHRTTYGAPFYHLDQLRAGDTIHVVDRERRLWVYEVVETRVVLPDEVWVVEPDALRRGRPLLTLTTCEPRFSAEKRLVVFGELTSASGSATTG